MELLFYSGIVSINDWKYTKSVGIKNQESVERLEKQCIV